MSREVRRQYLRHLKRPVFASAILGVVCCGLLIAGTHSLGAAQPSAADQCVSCHTDAAKLKVLTPPDPPPSEAGEG